MKKEETRLLKRLGIKIKEKTYVHLCLKEGLFEKTDYATYITLNIYKDGSDTPINMDKSEASRLCLMLGQLVAEGNNQDSERLKKAHPNQESWHIN